MPEALSQRIRHRLQYSATQFDADFEVDLVQIKGEVPTCTLDLRPADDVPYDATRVRKDLRKSPLTRPTSHDCEWTRCDGGFASAVVFHPIHCSPLNPDRCI